MGYDIPEDHHGSGGVPGVVEFERQAKADAARIEEQVEVLTAEVLAARDQIAAEHIDAELKKLSNPSADNPKDAVGIAKVPRSCISAPVLGELGLAMMEGALKYGRHNYRVAGVRASVYYDACNRHMDDWWEGVDIDPDSGLSHVTKAIASLTVLRDAMIQEKWVDDRPPKSPEGWQRELNARAKALLEKYPEAAEAFLEGDQYQDGVTDPYANGKNLAMGLAEDPAIIAGQMMGEREATSEEVMDLVESLEPMPFPQRVRYWLRYFKETLAAPADMPVSEQFRARLSQNIRRFIEGTQDGLYRYAGPDPAKGFGAWAEGLEVFDDTNTLAELHDIARQCMTQASLLDDIYSSPPESTGC